MVINKYNSKFNILPVPDSKKTVVIDVLYKKNMVYIMVYKGFNTIKGEVMEVNKWNNKGKIFLAATILLSLFSAVILYTSYDNVARNRNWFLDLILLFNCIISMRNSIKLKQRYHFIGSIILVFIVLAYILISRFNFW